MQTIRDYRTTRKVEETRCLKNNKPFRSAAQKDSARRMAKKVRGAFFAPAERQYHGRCICGKQEHKQCELNNLDRNNRS